MTIITNMATAAAALKQARVGKKLSQEALGYDIFNNGDGNTRISEYECRRATPRTDIFIRWANALGFDVVLREKENK